MIDLVVQARRGSSRLPDKAILEVDGEPLLGHLLFRMRRAALVRRVIVGTTDLPADDAIAAIAADYLVPVHRWPAGQANILDGFLAATDADVIVRVTADCPLLDPATVDMLIARFQMGDVDHVEPFGMPDGTWCEVVSRETLERIARAHDLTDEDREHVTLYARRRPQDFRLGFLDTRLRMNDERWDVNEPADFELVRRIIEALPGGFTFGDVVRLMRSNPDWRRINAHIERTALEGRLYTRSRTN